MTVFKDHEKLVIHLLTQSELTERVRQKLEAEAVMVNFETTGTGYFLTVSHDDLPQKRTICNDLLVAGTADGIETGFVVFLGNQELTIECFTTEDSLPDDFRQRNIAISVASESA